MSEGTIIELAYTDGEYETMRKFEGVDVGYHIEGGLIRVWCDNVTFIIPIGSLISLLWIYQTG